MKTLRALPFLLLLFLVAGIPVAYGQVTAYGIALDTIGSWVEESPEELLAINRRMTHEDSVVYEEDFFLLYYGSAYLDSYAPYGEKMLAGSVYELLDAEAYKKAVDLGRQLIEEHPGYTRGYYNLAVAYDYLGDTTRASVFIDRYYGLLGVAYYSGTGESVDSAFVVRSIDDEYLLIQEMGYPRGNQSLITDDNDIPFDVLHITIDEESEEIKDIYFNIYQPFELGLKRSFLESAEETEPALEAETELEETNGKKKRSKKRKKENK